jgi:hypothetical protein
MNGLKNCSDAYQVSVGPAGSALKNPLFVVSFLSLLLFSCDASREEKEYREKSAIVADSVAAYVPGIATDTINGVTHQFIRKARVKCRVKDVLQATRQIEELITDLGGYVTLSDLNSNRDQSFSVQVKKDSLREITRYTASSEIILRIPNKQLDSVMNRITGMAAFVDFRTVHAEDVKLELFSNQLAEHRYHEYKNRLQKKIDNKDDKLNRVTDAEENVLEKQTLADNKRVESYDLSDQVNYSTVSCSLYEDQKTFFNTVAAFPLIKSYEPPFSDKLAEAFQNGSDILKNFLLFFVNIWSVIVILLLLFLFTKKMVTYFQKKATEPYIGQR